MNELNDKFIELYNELLKNFSFFIPFQIIENEVTAEILNLINLELTQDFVDNYVDKLLYIDEDLTIKLVDSFEKISETNFNKIQRLEYNCFKLIYLKENIGKVSYNFLFKKYMEQVTIYTVICNKLIQYYYLYYPNNAIDPTPILIQQKNIFEKHLSDIEHKINLKGKKINTSDIINNIIESNIFKNYIKPKEITTPIINPQTNTTKEFKEFLKHDNKDEIEKIVKTQFSDLRGVSLRYLIEFFEEKKIILIGYGDKRKIHKSLKLLFENKNIGSQSSIFDAKIDREKDLKYKKAKNHFLEIFKNII